jgi:hypothetical protein
VKRFQEFPYRQVGIASPSSPALDVKLLSVLHHFSNSEYAAGSPRRVAESFDTTAFRPYNDSPKNDKN